MSDAFKELTGLDLALPGHPLAIGLLIMHLYASYSEATAPGEVGTVAEADPRIHGGATQVRDAVEVLGIVHRGGPIEDLILVAKDRWFRSFAGGAAELLQAGADQAALLEEAFRRKAATWAWR